MSKSCVRPTVLMPHLCFLWRRRCLCRATTTVLLMKMRKFFNPRRSHSLDRKEKESLVILILTIRRCWERNSWKILIWSHRQFQIQGKVAHKCWMLNDKKWMIIKCIDTKLKGVQTKNRRNYYLIDILQVNWIIWSTLKYRSCWISNQVITWFIKFHYLLSIKDSI